MHSSRMCTVCCGGRLSCHARSPSHACPLPTTHALLPCMPPLPFAMPLPFTMHAPLPHMPPPPCTPPLLHTPFPLPHMPHPFTTHAPSLPHTPFTTHVPPSPLHGPFKSICRSGANPEKTLCIRGGAMQVYHHNQ